MHTWYATISIFILLVSSTHGAITKRPKPHLSSANQFMAPQNAVRASLRLRPLVWDAKLERYAQWYANQRRSDCALEHSNGTLWDEECGHYTQIVWRETKRIGCARVDCFGGRGVFMTCNYDPPGNYIGEKPY
ncbi:hypothetical protein OIU74_025899 [Salix koriyanagi]|uniref:SCP domain-containing protein n=1 Tax=Salix koriyanagi TaxID=2511006 RepID=A0A9Q1A646_9ROSI|nr:hypothetical protein OIU74_025899 [Salix koriyanagi]